MAIPANNNQQQQPGMSVLTPQDASQLPEAQPTDITDEQLSSSQSATIQAGTPGQPSQAQQRGSTPRSGLFTNIRSYLQRNKPKAQKLATATAERSVGQQAQQVGQAVQQQRQQFGQQVEAQRQARRQALEQARGTISGAGQSGQLDRDQLKQFQRLQSGTQRFDRPGELDLASQSLAAQRVSDKAEAGKSAAGRRELLRDAFSRPEKQYTRGQRRLDELILAASPKASETFQQKIQEAGSRSQQDIEQAKQFAQAEKEALIDEQQQFQERLGQEAQQAFTSADTGLQAQQRASREQVQQALEALGQSESGYRSSLQKSRDLLNQYSSTLQRADEFESRGEIEKANLLRSFVPKDSQFQSVLGQNLDQASALGVSPEELSKLRTAASQERTLLYASPEQLSRRNALARLAGQQELSGINTQINLDDIQKAINPFKAGQATLQSQEENLNRLALLGKVTGRFRPDWDADWGLDQFGGAEAALNLLSPVAEKMGLSVNNTVEDPETKAKLLLRDIQGRF